MWPFNRRKRSPEPEPAPERQDWELWPTLLYTLPPDPNMEILIMRHGWDCPYLTRWRDLHPEFNIADVHWKPWTDQTIEHEGARQCLTISSTA